MFGSVLLFGDKLFLEIVTVTFTSLIYLEILNVYMEINKFHKFMVFALGLTFLVYTLTIILLPHYLDVSILTLKNLLLIGITAITAWAPFFIVSKLKKIFFPQTIEKLNQIQL